jgi:hypothetical protein
MGLSIRVKGFDKEIYDSGYGGFTRFRIAVAKSYNSEYGNLYEKWVECCLRREKFSDKDLYKMNKLANNDLNLLLYHSDCDGKLTPQECKKIYKITKDLKCDYPQNNYTTLTGKNQLDIFNEALRHCWKRRVNMWFE